MTVLRGDCVEVMNAMEADSIDAICCDPPYGLEFMGKEWDRLWTSADPAVHETFTEGNRDPRFHRTTAPFAGAPSYKAGMPAQMWHQEWAAAALRVAKPGAYLLAFGGTRTVHRMTCALEDAGWVIRDMLVWAYAQGFPKSRASLKPAWEPIVMARKPGASRDLNIDAARIGFASDDDRAESVGKNQHTRYANPASGRDSYSGNMPDRTDYQPGAGRWPANVILTDPIFDGGWDGVVGGGETGPMPATYKPNVIPADGSWSDIYGNGNGIPVTDEARGFGDSGTYSRFFLIPKAPTRERVLSDGRRSPHPTQKPEAVIRHLVTLVTPQGGTVLDPFLGSGTLGVVCEGLGMKWLGIEREPEYADWAEDRIADKRPAWSAA